MAIIDPLLERNKHFATSNAREGPRTIVVPSVLRHAGSS